MEGRPLGPYRVLSELGSGGMGTVFLAEVEGDASGVEKGAKVAIKVVHAHLLSTPGFFKRFLREAELGKQVRHENVVRTFDVDATLLDDKQVNYMVMEYVEGRSLRELLNDLGTVPEALLREIALQTAAGLAAIHEQDIVHRDLKPENVLITNDQRVRIMDLGVAKLQEASIAITKEGQFAGSLLYAAPEQLNEAAVGPASDLYSVGVMLQELATGRNPFRRDDAGAVIKAHLTLDPPRVTDHNPDISTFLAESIRKLLAKKPQDRFESARELLEVLQEGERSAWWTAIEPTLRRRESHLPRIQVNRETELHGREEELAILHEAWSRAKSGEGRTLLLEGEPGIGKTRLLDAFLRGLEDADLHVLYGSYPPSGGMGGLADAVIGKFGAVNLDESLRPYMTVTPSLLPAFAALIRHESPPTGSEPLQGDALHAVSCHVMRALAEEKPTIWIVDDLHFAPPASRDLILSMARAVEAHRVLLIGTARPGIPDDELAHFSKLRNFKRVPLSRLGAREVIELLQDALKSEMLAEKLGGKIAYKSDGVPFFVFEMMRGLKEGKFLKQKPDGSYEQTQLITDIEVPSAVKDLIEGRLKDLTESQRAILDVGAVQGISFDPDLVARVLEEKKVRVLRDLAELERRSGIVRGEAGACRFDQNQIQEVLYQGLMPDLRTEYHALLAEALVEREGFTEEDAPGADAHFAAMHALKGSRPELGLRYLDGALDYLERAHLNDAAINLAGNALDHARALTATRRVDVLLRKSARLTLVGRTQDDRAVLEEALELARLEEDPVLECRVLMRLGGRLATISEYEAAEDHLSRALALAREVNDKALIAAAVSSNGSLAWRKGDFEAAMALTEEEAAIARETGDQRLESSANGTLGIINGVLGRLGEAKRHIERQFELSKSLGVLGGQSTAAGNLGFVFKNVGEYEQARTNFARKLSLVRDGGDRFNETHALFGLGLVAEGAGDAEEARRQYDAVIALSREISRRDFTARSLVALARIDIQEGRIDAAKEHLEEARAMSEELHISGPLVVATAYSELLNGDPAAAADVLGKHESNAWNEERMEARLTLWKATRDAAHLQAAHELLDHLREHAPEEYRDSMIENVPLHREIAEAWKEHGS